MSPRPHRPAKSCSSHNRFLLNYRLPVRGSRARPMVSRSRPSIWYPPCTRQSLHKAVRHINAAAATRKDKVGRPTMFRTARLSQAVTGVVGEKTARARGAIEEHPRSTRGTLESASQASGYQRTCATLAPRALSGMRTNLPPGPGLFTAQFLRCTNVTWVCRIPSADGQRPRAFGKGLILALPPPIAFGTRSIGVGTRD